MPRFAILIHDHPFLHWDFLLEGDEECRTWRLLSPPDGSSDEIPAEALPAHRLLYLDYEGPVSGGRGTVTLWDRGVFTWQINEPVHCEVCLSGHRWRGLVRLEKKEDDSWSVIFDPEIDGLRH
ncbi:MULTISPECIES: DNA polymerase ligase N-terminal domain-containing protein [unclassified Schlesneria]|uniref:DNA polymerase ligase N-terminal domain-containing protein n=1 Tax=unclassified Schlesneria TaxID=2762017 RepID=UPI002F1EE234